MTDKLEFEMQDHTALITINNPRCQHLGRR